MRYSKIVKTYISIISTIGILNFISLYFFSFLIGKSFTFHKFAFTGHSLSFYIINNIQFANVIFIFLSFIVLLYFIFRGIINGKKNYLPNKHFYVALILIIIFAYLYYPFTPLKLNNIVWYVIRFIGILSIFYILRICEIGKYIDYKKYNELKINDDDNKNYIFSDIEKTFLFTLISICILCVFMLSSQIFLAAGGFPNPDETVNFILEYNMSGPGYYIEFIIVIIFIAMLYFLFKGLIVSVFKKLYTYLYFYIFLIVADAAFIIIFWPEFNPKLTSLAWHSIHLIAVVYLLAIIYFSNTAVNNADVKQSAT
ncbi:MAG TPA: hypothetical protein QF753_13305 [Victivallales bacterium]|nr:hypothetical protein [Victivallales bacterium]